MSVITRRPSVPELSQQILTMAKAGVYRESVFEALRPMATKKQISAAIAHAKRFGLHSVASLRDDELGTYYQVDLVKYQSLEHAIATPAHLGDDAELLERVMSTNTAMQRMLVVAQGLAALLGIIGTLCLLNDRYQLGIGLLSGAFSAASVWAMQRSLSKKSL
ncbi:MAG: hypothetical protein KME45_30360 [Stenomitos rutilans HA7619-LM2]|jgi:hypothetical protein|nr:hypothetical protein [Stenomitos rutilans HA7619-LM2]